MSSSSSTTSTRREGSATITAQYGRVVSADKRETRTPRLRKHAGERAAEDTLERRVDAGGERAFDHRGLAERRDLDPRGREREPVLEVAADRLEQIRVGADAAAEHDEREIERRGEREDVERDAAGRLLDDRGSRPRRPRVAAAKISRTSKGGSSTVLFPAASSAASWDSDAAHGSTSSARPLRTASSSPAFPLWPRCSFQSSMTAAPRPAPTSRKAKSATSWATPFVARRPPRGSRRSRASPAREARPRAALADRPPPAPEGREPRRARRRGRRPPAAPRRRSPAGRRAACAVRSSERPEPASASIRSSTEPRLRISSLARTSPPRSQSAVRTARAPKSTPRTTAASGSAS